MAKVSATGDVEGRETLTFGNEFAGISFEGGPTMSSGYPVLNPKIEFGGTLGAGFGASANVSPTFKENETITELDLSGALIAKGDLKVTYSDVSGWEFDGGIGLGAIFGRSANILGLGTVGASGKAGLVMSGSSDGTTFLGIEAEVEGGTLTVDGKVSAHLGLAGMSGHLPPNVGMAGDPYALGLDPNFIGQGYVYGHSYQYGYDPRGSGGNWGYYDLDSVDFRRAEDIIAERAAAVAAAQERADRANDPSPIRTGSEGKDDDDDRSGREDHNYPKNTVNVRAANDGSIVPNVTVDTSTRGSGGGVDGATITGAYRPVENHSDVSTTTGIAGRGVYDVDGPETTGAVGPVTAETQPPTYDYDHTGPGPVILDLDGDGIEVSLDFTAGFDVDNDGYREAGTWAAVSDVSAYGSK